MAHCRARAALVRPHAAARSALPAPRAPRIAARRCSTCACASSRATCTCEACSCRHRCAIRKCCARCSCWISSRTPRRGHRRGRALHRPDPRPHRPGVVAGAARCRRRNSSRRFVARLRALMGEGKCGSPATVDSYRPGRLQLTFRGASGRRAKSAAESQPASPERPAGRLAKAGSQEARRRRGERREAKREPAPSAKPLALLPALAAAVPRRLPPSHPRAGARWMAAPQSASDGSPALAAGACMRRGAVADVGRVVKTPAHRQMPTAVGAVDGRAGWNRDREGRSPQHRG